MPENSRKENPIAFLRVGLFPVVFMLVSGFVLHGACTPNPGKNISDCNRTYKIFALSYASGTYSKRNMVYGSKNERSPLEFVFFVVRGDSRTILVDTGSENQALLKAFEARSPRSPLRLLGQLGIRPEHVTDILLSHAHWDHVGCVSKFPGARVWIQAREFHHVRSLHFDKKKQFINGYSAMDAAALEELKKKNRLDLIKGDREILPCFWAFVVKDGHTPGSQFVAINTKDGVFVLGSDNVYLYENIEKQISIGDTISRKNNRRSIRRMLRLASLPEFVIPGHDPGIFLRFSCPMEHIACLAGCDERSSP